MFWHVSWPEIVFVFSIDGCRERENSLFHFHQKSACCLLNNASISRPVVNSPVIRVYKVDVAALDGWVLWASCLFALTDRVPVCRPYEHPVCLSESSKGQCSCLQSVETLGAFRVSSREQRWKRKLWSFGYFSHRMVKLIWHSGNDSAIIFNLELTVL